MIEFKDGKPVGAEPIPDGKYYTVSEFAEELDVSEPLVRMWINRGQLLAEHFYGRVYIPEDARVYFKRLPKNV